MDAAVVELDTLADAVGTAAQDHDLGLVGADGVLVLADIGRIVVGAVLGSADMDAFPVLGAAEGLAGVADVVLLHIQNLCQIVIGEAVLLGPDQSFVGRNAALEFLHQSLFLFHQFLHLLNEIVFDLGDIEDLINGHTLAEGLIHDKVTLRRDVDQKISELIEGHLVIAVDVAQTIAAFFQGPDGFLEGFLVGLADAHDFADRAHLRAQLVLDAFEFFKCPAGEFDDDEIAGGDIFVQCPEAGIREVRQCQAGRQLGRDQSDREAGRLGSQG